MTFIKKSLKKAKKDERDPRTELAVILRGRPLLLGSLDQMCKYSYWHYKVGDDDDNDDNDDDDELFLWHG